jgi:hypothetical protein
MKKSFSRFLAMLSALVLASACSGGLESPTSPSIVSSELIGLGAAANPGPLVSVTADGTRLVWEMASVCPVMKPYPPAAREVAGKQPESTLPLNGGEVLRAFWPLTPETVVVDGRQTKQEFLVANFVKDSGEWRLCQADEARKDKFFCTISNNCGGAATERWSATSRTLRPDKLATLVQ